MAFYDLPKQERIHVVANMSNDILNEISPLLVFVYSNSGQASPTIYVQEAFWIWRWVVFFEQPWKSIELNICIRELLLVIPGTKKGHNTSNPCCTKSADFVFNMFFRDYVPEIKSRSPETVKKMINVSRAGLVIESYSIPRQAYFTNIMKLFPHLHP